MLVNQQVGLAIAIVAIVLFAIVLWDEIRIEVRLRSRHGLPDAPKTEPRPQSDRTAFR